jgi:hypothetical protein
MAAADIMAVPATSGRPGGPSSSRVTAMPMMTAAVTARMATL